MNQHMGTMKVKLQEQRNAEEQERLRQIQLKMEAEQKAKEAEEQRIREEEETRKKKVFLQEIGLNFMEVFKHFSSIRRKWKCAGSKKNWNVSDSKKKTGKLH
jgi:hypothetical protein